MSTSSDYPPQNPPANAPYPVGDAVGDASASGVEQPVGYNGGAQSSELVVSDPAGAYAAGGAYQAGPQAGSYNGAYGPAQGTPYGPPQGTPYGPAQGAPYAAPGAGAYGAPPFNPQSKSKVAVLLFAIFLGSLGIHNFYLGHTGKAVAQLLITLLTFGWGGVVTGPWALIEGILAITAQPGSHPWGVDAQGVPLH